MEPVCGTTAGKPCLTSLPHLLNRSGSVDLCKIYLDLQMTGFI